GVDSNATTTRGSPGDHVWFKSSVRVAFRYEWFFDTWGPNAAPPPHGESCWRFDRGKLPDALRATLEGLLLGPLNDGCSSDGFSYYELTVWDSDGTSAKYRDTGCDHLRLDGAKAMLPTGTIDQGELGTETDSSCP